MPLSDRPEEQACVVPVGVAVVKVGRTNGQFMRVNAIAKLEAVGAVRSDCEAILVRLYTAQLALVIAGCGFYLR